MIETTMRDAVTVIRMAHGKASALDVEFCRELTARLEKVKASSGGAVVLTGTGDIFSAGVDLLRLLSGGVEYLEIFLPAMRTLFETLFLFPKPVVAAVNGHAIAGGCILTCAADRRIMANGGGRIGINELLVGVPFPVVALEIVRFAVAPQHFQRLAYSGATVAPTEAQAMGFVDEVVEPQELMERARAIAEQMLSIPAPTFELTKRQLRGPAQEQIRAESAVFDRSVDEIWAHGDTHEVIRRFITRTFKKPRSGPN
jgi:enoyl-CoA hydratase